MNAEQIWSFLRECHYSRLDRNGLPDPYADRVRETPCRQPPNWWDEFKVWISRREAGEVLKTRMEEFVMWCAFYYFFQKDIDHCSIQVVLHGVETIRAFSRLGILEPAQIDRIVEQSMDSDLGDRVEASIAARNARVAEERARHRSTPAYAPDDVDPVEESFDSECYREGDYAYSDPADSDRGEEMPGPLTRVRERLKSEGSVATATPVCLAYFRAWHNRQIKPLTFPEDDQSVSIIRDYLPQLDEGNIPF